MPDREKVVRAYECVITRGKSECECGKCDYHIKDSAVFFCDNQRVLTDALTLLKEQDDLGTELTNAVELIHKKNERIEKLLKEQEAVVPYIDIDEAKCPVCKVKLTRQELIGDDVLFEDFYDYCPHCGRKVKWNEA